MHADSSRPENGKADAYAALIKPGDAVETPDGEVWVVNEITGEELAVVSAQRSGELVRVDAWHAATETTLPRELVTKVADARQVRR